MKRYGHIYIWIIVGILFGFGIFLAIRDAEKRDLDLKYKQSECLPGEYINSFKTDNEIEHLICKMPNGLYWDGYFFVRKHIESEKQ